MVTQIISAGRMCFFFRGSIAEIFLKFYFIDGAYADFQLSNLSAYPEVIAKPTNACQRRK